MRVLGLGCGLVGVAIPSTCTGTCTGIPSTCTGVDGDGAAGGHQRAFWVHPRVPWVGMGVAACINGCCCCGTSHAVATSNITVTTYPLCFRSVFSG